MLRACGVCPSKDAKFCAISRTFMGSGPLTRNLSGHPTGGPSSRTHAALSLVEFWPLQCGKDARLNAGANLETLRHDDALCEKIIRKLLVEWQVEADGTAA